MKRVQYQCRILVDASIASRHLLSTCSPRLRVTLLHLPGSPSCLWTQRGSRPAERARSATSYPSSTMSFLSSFATSVTKSASESYNQLRGPAGAPQSASETIDKLCDRLANATLVEDRRAALLGLKGLSRDWKAVRWLVQLLLLSFD